MALGGLHVVVEVLQDTGLVQIGGAYRARRIDAAPPPDGFVVVLYDHALVRIKRPAVEAGQPSHTGWILAYQKIEACRFHALLNAIALLLITAIT